jgi:hypothetical protein
MLSSNVRMNCMKYMGILFLLPQECGRVNYEVRYCITKYGKMTGLLIFPIFLLQVSHHSKNAENYYSRHTRM